jgi:hypothetical protein
MKQFQSVKTILCFAFVCLLILLRAPRAGADLYRITAEIERAFCTGQEYCTMMDSLPFAPGSTLYIMVEYDPHMTPFYEGEEPGIGRRARYSTQPPVSLITPTGDTVTVMTSSQGALQMSRAPILTHACTFQISVNTHLVVWD